MDSFIGNFGASVCSIFICQPVDVIKTNYQINKLNIVSNIKRLHINYGITGFYKGLTANILTVPVFWSIFFQIKSQMHNHGYNSNAFLACYISGNISSLITNPLFVIKTRMQTNGNKTILSTGKKIYKANGVAGFFKGAPASMLNNSKLGIQFPLYQFFKDKEYSIFTSSLIAKCVSSSILYPMDLIRVQQRNLDVKKSLIDISKQIYKNHKIAGFYRGVLLYNMISVPQFVIMINLIEFIKK